MKVIVAWQANHENPLRPDRRGRVRRHLADIVMTTMIRIGTVLTLLAIGAASLFLLAVLPP